MEKTRKGTSHKALLFLVFIFLFFIVINCIPFLLKNKDLGINLFGDDEVFLQTILPITDISAKEIDTKKIQNGIIGYAEFSIELEGNSSKPVPFEICLTDISGDNVLKYDYIKVYLTDENGVPYKQFDSNIVPSYKDIGVSLKQPDKRVLLSSTINSSEVKTFKLRVWVADTYVLGDEIKEFRGKISVKTIS